ncbi:uncharacterized protein LOC128230217 isoform X2 [Mya arenaria]|uniref:uncharacterized protein LOC128230217 isoform X2 n=1 Tax=Mya arenaria TaxID=6604 RepID=UPI0022E53906|nr:uncharacterized protein LOC128230217 isoform X2 [Mya arenaria]
MARNRKLSDSTTRKCARAVFDSNCDITIPACQHMADVNLEESGEPPSDDYSQTAIYRQLRPLLMCMKLFGLYFFRSRKENGKFYTEGTFVYCLFVNVLAVLNVVRSFTVFRIKDEFDNVLFQKLLFAIWSTECAFKTSLLLWNCYKNNGLPKFFRQWATVCNNANISKVCLYMMMKYIVLSFLFIFVNSVVFTLILVYVPVLRHIYLEVIWRNAADYENVVCFQAMLSFLSVLNSSASIFPASLFVVLSFAVGKRFKKFSCKLEKAIECDLFHAQIEDFRIAYEDLSGLVETLDEIFSPLLAAVYFANIPMFCLVLYTTLSSIDIHLSIVLINLFWLSFILLQMTLVSLTAVWINVMAHSPLEHIYTIRFSRSSNDTQLQMFMFLNRLTGTQVGLSAMKLFVVDKPTILTIAGMMITYFVLLIEFKMPADTNCACHVNGTIVMDNSTLLISHVSYT